jgi:hypothetical protein
MRVLRVTHGSNRSDPLYECPGVKWVKPIIHSYVRRGWILDRDQSGIAILTPLLATLCSGFRSDQIGYHRYLRHFVERPKLGFEIRRLFYADLTLTYS